MKKKAQTELRKRMQSFLNLNIHQVPIDFKVIASKDFGSYERSLIEYEGSESDSIRAYFFVPKEPDPKGAILVHHQHNGERHLGKSEVSGILGDPYQAFCPELAKNGIICLAPDAICFEDRRKNQQGTDPAADPDDDFLQHYNEMCYRLLIGKTLMKKVLEDSFIAISLLFHHPLVDRKRIGILGHSYGGNSVIFHTPFDERVKFACSSGAVCSYADKFQNGTGIEMAEVIPGFTQKFDIQDLLACTIPSKILILSASEDKYSNDAQAIYEAVCPLYKEENVEHHLIHQSFEGGHGLDAERFRFIIDWFVQEYSVN